jgi:hypothetical protein
MSEVAAKFVVWPKPRRGRKPAEKSKFVISVWLEPGARVHALFFGGKRHHFRRLPADASHAKNAEGAENLKP